MVKISFIGYYRTIRMKERLARIVSDVFNPFLVSFVVIIVLTMEVTSTAADALKWASIALVTSVLPVFFIVVFLVRRGKLEGIFVIPRQQRTPLYFIASILAAVGCLVLVFIDAPEMITAIFISGLVAMIAFGVINLFWKISLHTAFVAGSATILTIVYGAVGTVVIGPLLLLAWARVSLGFHTTAQVTAGALLPAGIILVVFWGFGLLF